MYDQEIMQTPDIFSGGAMLRKAPSLIPVKSTGVGVGMPELAVAASKDALAVPYLMALTRRHDNANAQNIEMNTAHNNVLLQGMSQDRELAGNEVVAKLIGQLAAHKRFTQPVLNGIDQIAPAMNANGARENASAINELDAVANPMSEVFKNIMSGLNSGMTAGYDSAPVAQQLIQGALGIQPQFMRVPRSAELQAQSRVDAAERSAHTSATGTSSRVKSVLDSKGNKVPTEVTEEITDKSTDKGTGTSSTPASAPQSMRPTTPTADEDAERKATQYIMQHMGNDVTFEPSQGDHLTVRKPDGTSKTYSISKILQLMQGQ